MKNLVFVYVFLTLICNNLSYSKSCLPQIDSCNFYLCKEQEAPCGIKGYWLAYGYKYCSLFLGMEVDFPGPSKAWLQNVRFCLQSEINEFPEGLTCDESYLKSFKTHVNCYVNTGFCQLSLKERAAIIWTLRSALVIPITYTEGLELAYQCSWKVQSDNY